MPSFKYLVFLLAIIFANGDDKYYTTKYDNIDYRSILNSDRLLKNYYNCLMDKGPCTSDGKELKNVLPDALKTECSKCSPKQREAAKEVVDHIIRTKKEWFNDLAAKYDPDGVYKQKYKDEWLEMGYTL